MEKRYKPGEFAKLVNRKLQTLRAWDKSGKLPAKRTIDGHPLMNAIEQRKLKTLVIAHKDRLCRFGYDYFEHFAKRHGCEIRVANAQNMSRKQEIMEDLMAVIHTFSCRLYGVRKYKKKLRGIIFARPPEE